MTEMYPPLPDDEFVESGETEAYSSDAREQYIPSVVPVRVMFDESKTVSPEFCGMYTWPITQIGQGPPTQFLQRRYMRFKAKFTINFPGAGVLYLNTKIEPLTLATPVGYTINVAALGNFTLLPDYDAQQPMYGIASIAGVTISVMDESYGQVQ